MIWHIAVHPDFRRMKIGNQLLNEAEKLAKELNLNRTEAGLGTTYGYMDGTKITDL